MSLPTRLVTFDVTNTLIRASSSVGKVYLQAALKLQGGERPPSGIKGEDVSKAFGAAFSIQHQRSPCFGAQGERMSSREWWEAVVHGTFQRAGMGDHYSDASFAELYENRFNGTDECGFWVVKDGAVDALEALKADDVILGCITNSDARYHTVLKNLGLDGYFDFVLTSEEIGVEKPDPELFHVALERAGDVDEMQAVHVGDSATKDVLGALDAGWQACVYCGTATIEIEGVLPMKDLKDLPSIIKSIPDVIDGKGPAA